ncbi:MAG: lipid-binding SYLF domain-containing protein [Desulforhopalus sp.]|jgi:lipid-binding SYLF domain-containing protein
MKGIVRLAVLFVVTLSLCTSVWADDYSDTKKMFEDAGIKDKFQTAFGYALFPTIGKAGFVVGGAYGKGRVYMQGDRYYGDTAMTQATIGFQMGGAGFSQVVFFQDKNAFGAFVRGNFEFGADVKAVALTAAAGARANTGGSSATASGGKNNATIGDSGYTRGMATYTITKGGLMYEATVGGQKFSFTKR